MKPGSVGLAGGGIYFATTPELTGHKAHKKGVILEATVALGKILTLDAAGDRTMTLQKLKSMGYGSVCIARAVSSGHEYVVYDPGQVMSIIRDGALPGGYQEGEAVYSSETVAFKCGNKIKYGERGVVRGRSDDGNGLEVKFDGGVLVDRRLHQVSNKKPGLPGGYQVGAVVFATDKFKFTDGRKVRHGERGVVRGQSDDGNGLKVKFDGGMLVDFCLHQVSQTRPPPRDSTTAAGLGAAAGAALCVLLLPIGL